MTDIRPLTQLADDDLRSLIVGYTSQHRYQVDRTPADAQSPALLSLTLTRVPLQQPYVKRYAPLEEEDLAHYHGLPAGGFCFGAYADGNCVALALAEPQDWNRSLHVLELHVAPHCHRQGIGARLLEAVEDAGRAAGLRTLVCETQNTNVPAIDFYRRQGFTVDGIDLSLYSNDDFPDGEVALFMKKPL